MKIVGLASQGGTHAVGTEIQLRGRCSARTRWMLPFCAAALK